MSKWKLKGNVETGSDSENDEKDHEDQEDQVEELDEEDDRSKNKKEETKKPTTATTRRNTRQKGVVEEEIPDIPISSRSTKKIMIVHKGTIESGWDNVEQVTLKHPGTGNKGVFLIDVRKTDTDSKKESKNFLFEIMTMEQESSSWFLDEGVVSDGNIYVSTPVDPLFFVLSYIKKTTQAMPLEDHLSDGFGNPRIAEIICQQLLNCNQLENIAVKKECDDIVAFKYSEENTLSWLSQKVENTSKYLAERDITSSEASISANFTRSSNGVGGDAVNRREEYLRYACEIVGEYLDEELKKKVFAKFGLPTVQEKNLKRKNEGDCLSLEESQNKKVKVTDGENIVGPLEDYGSSKNSANSPAITQKGKAKEKEFLKAAKGTPSLLKFFAPKAK